MCGLLISRNSEARDFYIRRRGPDRTCSIRLHGYSFTHYLLAVTGEVTPQPFVDGDVVCLYNGEIYNHPYERSDGEVLIPLYRAHGEDLVRHLDGEFALALYDFGRGIAIFATDPFATKPLWVKGTEAASYESGVGGTQMPADTMRIVDLKTGKADVQRIWPFDFDHQHKDTYDDWIAAFEEAVRKRAYQNCFITLSSGYDSGAIDCALAKTGVDYKLFSIEGQENLDLLRTRNHSGVILRMTEEIIREKSKFLRAYTDKYTYRLQDNIAGLVHEDLLEDTATIGLAWIFTLANEERRKVCLSGQGADEILTDYSQWPWATELKGVFPDKLRVWRNFYGNYQRAFLAKEEYIAGTYGIETRYPFLDRSVVQEFLWLTPELKNRYYKAPLHAYLTRNEYPFEIGKKTGFLIT